MLATSRATVVTGPSTEPVTIAQLRKQLELSPTDDAHDDQLTLLGQAAREQWEHDTDSVTMAQTLSVTAPYLSEFALPKRPIQSITHIKYYSGGSLATVPTTVYSLDAPRRMVRLNELQSWPSADTRWDAAIVTYVAGYSSTSAVPAIAKQAILLLVGQYFENRDMMSSAMSLNAYADLVQRFRRPSYP